MKLFAAQFKPIPGEIDANLNKHLALIELAHKNIADLICFPELSLTGYEPGRLAGLGDTLSHPGIQTLCTLARDYNLVLAVGLPVPAPDKPRIGMAVIQPDQTITTYCKQWLHEDEHAYFTAGDTPLVLNIHGERIAPAICFESKQPAHLKQALAQHPTVYLTSVASDAAGVAKAQDYYSTIAKQYKLYVLMANFSGQCDNFICDGQSSVWDREGNCIAALSHQDEGLIGVCTSTNQGEVLRLGNLAGF